MKSIMSKSIRYSVVNICIISHKFTHYSGPEVIHKHRMHILWIIIHSQHLIWDTLYPLHCQSNVRELLKFIISKETYTFHLLTVYHIAPSCRQKSTIYYCANCTFCKENKITKSPNSNDKRRSNPKQCMFHFKSPSILSTVNSN